MFINTDFQPEITYFPYALTPQYSIEERPQQSSYPQEYYKHSRTLYGGGSPIRPITGPEIFYHQRIDKPSDLQRTSQNINPAIVFDFILDRAPKNENVLLDLCIERTEEGCTNVFTGYKIDPGYEGCNFFVITVNGHVLGRIIRYPGNHDTIFFRRDNGQPNKPVDCEWKGTFIPRKIDDGHPRNHIEFPAQYLNASGTNQIEIELMSNTGSSYAIRDISLSDSTWDRPPTKEEWINAMKRDSGW